MRCDTHAGVEAAHVAVGDAASVDDVVVDHLLAGGAGTVFVDPSRLKPVVAGDLAKVHRACDDVGDAPASGVRCMRGS